MSVDVIRECRPWFGIPDIKVLVVKRKKKFLMKYANSADGLRQLFGIGALWEYYSSVYFLFYLLLVFLLPYRIYGENKVVYSHVILAFPHQTSWQYYDGELLTGASNACRGYKNAQFSTNISLYLRQDTIQTMETHLQWNRDMPYSKVSFRITLYDRE